MFERVDVVFDNFKKRFGNLVSEEDINKEEESIEQFIDEYDLKDRLIFHNQFKERLGVKKTPMLEPLPREPLLLIDTPLTIGYHTKVPVMYVDTIEGYTAVFLPGCEEFFAVGGKILNHREFYKDCDDYDNYVN